MQTSTDFELLSRLCCEQASQSDWRRFYTGYQSLIKKWCIKSGVPANELDDVFHDILIKLVSGLFRYQQRDGKRFRSWLKTVVINSVTDRLRVSGNCPFPKLLPDSVLEIPDAQTFQLNSDIGSLADQLVEETSAAAKILAAVRVRVKEATWAAFVQRELMQIEAATIAAELGIKRASVYQSCSRVRTIIKEESKRFFDQND